MKIKVLRDAICGKVLIPANEYWVSLHTESSEIKLTAGGKDITLKATKRRQQGKGRITTVQFYSGGGRIWSLVVNTPKNGEWVAFLDYAS